jgi:hypothetical protein
LVPAEGESPPTLEAQFAWLHAFAVTWHDPRCGAPSDRFVRCDFALGNRLAEAQTGETSSGSATFRVVDGAIEMTTAPFPALGAVTSLDAFIYWVNATNPETARRIWVDGDAGLIVTEESARLLDEQLTAFLESGAVSLEEDETVAGALVDALEARDAGELDDAVTSDVTELVGWDRTDWPEMVAWMEANQDQWRLNGCHPVDVDVHGCEIDVTDALTTAARVERPLFAVVEVSGDRISAITISDQSDDYAELALQPFLDWLQANHPDEFDEVWSNADGELVPQPTARAAELHARHVAEYQASEGES